MFIIGWYYSNPRTEAIRSLGSGVMYYCTILYYHSQGLTLAPLHSAPLDPLTPLDVLLSSSVYFSFSSGSACTSTSLSDSISDSDSEYVSAARYFDVSQSMPFWSDHLLDTPTPPLGVVCSHRSRIGRVAMYCATVFCLFVIYFLISVNPAYFMAPTREG